jgi:hypothetical protein
MLSGRSQYFFVDWYIAEPDVAEAKPSAVSAEINESNMVENQWRVEYKSAL